MSALNTLFNYSSARHNRSTAYTLSRIEQANRERDLRARGWLRPGSTPADVATAEAVLAAQMRARMRPSVLRRAPFAWVWTVAVVGGLLGVGFLAAGPDWSVRGSGLALLVIVAGIVVIGHRRVAAGERRRAFVHERARDVNGQCGWCGQPSPHWVEGWATTPRVYHALEIEQYVSSIPR